MKMRNLIFELLIIIGYNVGIFFDIFKNGFKLHHIIINTVLMFLLVIYFYRYDIKVYDILDRIDVLINGEKFSEDEVDKKIEKEFDVIK